MRRSGHSSARTTSSIKSGAPLVGWAFIGNGCLASVTGDGRGGLVDGDAGVGSCGVADCGGVSTELAGGGGDGGGDCRVGGGCLGRGSDTSGRAVGGVVNIFCGGCRVGWGDVERLFSWSWRRPSGVGVQG